MNSRQVNKERVLKAIAFMVSNGKVKTMKYICDFAGVHKGYFNDHPKLRSLYDEAVRHIKGQQSSYEMDAKRLEKIIYGSTAKPRIATCPELQKSVLGRKVHLSQRTLKLLRSPDITERNTGIQTVIRLLGAESSLSKDWNLAIEWLDQNYPGWRGYPNPTVSNPNLVEIVA